MNAVEVLSVVVPLALPLVARRRCGWWWYVLTGTFPPKWCRRIKG